MNNHKRDRKQFGRTRPMDGAFLAVLSNQHTGPFGTAVCKISDIEIDENGVSPRVQVVPDGFFKSSVDGRPNDTEHGAWLMDDIAWTMLQHYLDSRTNDLHFDYEHQTIFTEKNGQPAPASGWVKPSSFEYVPGKGVFALNVKWTPKASAALREDEYRYISPVFDYGSDGRPIRFRHFALTNDPAIDGMENVVALKTKTPGDKTMNEATQLLKLLGVTVADGQEPTAEQYATATTALKALKTKADETDIKTAQLKSANEQVAALKAAGGNGQVDLTKWVPRADYDALASETATLRTENSTLSIEQQIEKAREEGRISNAETNYFKQLGEQQGAAVLKTQLDARTPIAALKSQQTTTTTKTPPKGQDSGELDSADLAVLKASGLDPEAFKKQKGAQQ
ncbi:phage scaffold protein [Pseudoalteromonas luteoviolacea CPMOR-1]|uniref:Phage scaffold protein n=1 Tax=Pseudoalteromonas luteoviolacea CPMOR-1 TaxID=1365248 RepID=A0A167GZZ9_9GAMM|nr:phage protease [Pseudoalteromonas luteoviolacea]KZN57483.1 phage scaffold protein [Pseudoalteromonas luteoviolacea CPMOR-1]